MKKMFAVVLAAIAIMPFLARHFWERAYGYVAVGLGLHVANYCLAHNPAPESEDRGTSIQPQGDHPLAQRSRFFHAFRHFAGRCGQCHRLEARSPKRLRNALRVKRRHMGIRNQRASPGLENALRKLTCLIQQTGTDMHIIRGTLKRNGNNHGGNSARPARRSRI